MKDRRHVPGEEDIITDSHGGESYWHHAVVECAIKPDLSTQDGVSKEDDVVWMVRFPGTSC